MELNVKGIGKVEIKEKITCFQLAKKIFKEDYKKYLAVLVNNALKDLHYNDLKKGDNVEFIDITHPDGMRIYVRTLSFIYIKACKDIYEDSRITIEHSLNKGLYSEIKKDNNLTIKSVNKIKKRIKELINEDIIIKKQSLPVSEASNIFKNQNMEDKMRLLKYWHKEKKDIYEIDGYFDTFYGYMAPTTSYINKFDLKLFYPGIIINFPRKESNFELPEYIEQKKLSKIFREAENWGNIMDVADVGALNEKIQNRTIQDMIRINEALHEKKIAYIADEICNDKDIKIVLIAGPSSSGKTTFAQRLSIQLKANGKKTYSISLDDYFVDRERTPKDEYGNYDFDTIDALDKDLFNEHLLNLISGKEVQIPVFNFKEGKREFTRPATKLSKEHIIIIEGIHGLNEELTMHIPQKNKFKIYISALTQLNIDGHNRISTTDSRLIRRIVRDSRYRGHDALRTITLWNNVRKGEEKYIFPFQENADVMFNSSLVYELAVLKKYAVDLIEKITIESEFYSERQRLIKFLSYFKTIEDEKSIPYTSILREFIGESCFR